MNSLMGDIPLQLHKLDHIPLSKGILKLNFLKEQLILPCRSNGTEGQKWKIYLSVNGGVPKVHQ